MNAQTKEIGIHEVEIHYKRPLITSMEKIQSSTDVNDLLRDVFNPNTMDLKEIFWAIYLTNANHILHVAEIAKGNTHGVIVNNKEILQIALKLNASSIILAHNHPSGKLSFSQKDKTFTEKLKQLSKIMEVSLLDHIVITSEGYISYADEGHTTGSTNITEKESH